MVPAFSEYCRVSPVARAADRVAISVVEAVLVMKSELLLPVSVPRSMPEIVVVGSVVSNQALTPACVAALPAASLTFAVTAAATPVAGVGLVQDSSSHMVMVHSPPLETVAVSVAPPYVTVTVSPFAPLAVPVMVKLAASSSLM